MSKVVQQLEQSAIEANRLNWTWDRYWQMHSDAVCKVEQYNRAKFRRLVKRLLALVTSGNTDGQKPVGDGLQPWECDDTKHNDTRTEARFDWEANKLAPRSKLPFGHPR